MFRIEQRRNCPLARPTGGFDTVADLVTYRTGLQLRNESVHALIGPVCLEGIVAVAPTCAEWNIPVVSYMSIAYQASANRTDLYRTMANVGVFSSQQGHRECSWSIFV